MARNTQRTQRKAAKMLVAGNGTGSIAREFSMRLSTLERWMRNPVFMAMVEEELRLAEQRRRIDLLQLHSTSIGTLLGEFYYRKATGSRSATMLDHAAQLARSLDKSRFSGAGQAQTSQKRGSNGAKQAGYGAKQAEDGAEQDADGA